MSAAAPKVRASVALAEYLEPGRGGYNAASKRRASGEPRASSVPAAPAEPQVIYVLEPWPFWRRPWWAALFTAIGFVAGINLFS